MPIKVVSFSNTRLAGAPIRISRAVNRHPEIESRHVDTERWGIFDHDHVHAENAERTLALAEQADVIHLYNRLDLESDDFAPVNFGVLQRRGVRFVRMFESTPQTVAEKMKQPLQRVLSDPIPKLVIAQYPERYLPTARVVPNIVPETDPSYLPPAEPPRIDLVYSPSKPDGAWVHRWNTKGMPETTAMLNRCLRCDGISFRIVHGASLDETMQAKRQARLIIDELVTGSYHLSGLEGLSLGKPVLAYLDDRTDHVLRVMSGAARSPFINVRLDDAAEVIAGLVQEPGACAELGRASREWIEKYWSSEILSEHFVRAYRDVLEDPTRIRRQEELTLDTPVARLRAVVVPDLIHQAQTPPCPSHGPTRRLLSLARSQLAYYARRFRPKTAAQPGAAEPTTANGPPPPHCAPALTTSRENCNDGIRHQDAP